MPKKSPAARGATQRNKAKVQKSSFELVRPLSDEDTPEQQVSGEELTAVAVADSEPQQQPQERKKEKAASSTSRVEASAVTSAATSTSSTDAIPVTPKAGNASARLAARRQATQRAQQRNAAALITPEHFAYVRKDLITIAVLATVMFATIVLLYFFFGSIL